MIQEANYHLAVFCCRNVYVGRVFKLGESDINISILFKERRIFKRLFNTNCLIQHNTTHRLIQHKEIQCFLLLTMLLKTFSHNNRF